MANRHRGEVDLRLQGRDLTLCLTLGALAEIESAFGAGDLAALGERLASGRLAARDIIVLLAAAARGGGESLDAAGMAALVTARDLPLAIAALGELFTLAFGRAPDPR